MISNVKCTLLGVREPYEYEIQGKKGISLTATFLIGDKTLIAKINSDLYAQLKDMPISEGYAEFEFAILNSEIVKKPKCISFK